MALQQHRVAQQSSAQVGIFKVAGKSHAVIEIRLAQISSTQVAVIEDSATQVAFTEVKASQGRLQEFGLLQIAAVHVCLEILEGSLATQLGGGYGPGRCQDQQPCNQGGNDCQKGSHGQGSKIETQNMSTMAMALRVVVPPHPLIGHWLAVLRDRHTPAPLYASATTELGRWLSYEALRDWLPHRRIKIDAPLGPAEAEIVDGNVPLLVLPLLSAGLGLWQGGQTVVPSARVMHLWRERQTICGLDKPIHPRSGVLIFCASVSTGECLNQLLDQLAEFGVRGDRLRVVTALASGPGLQVVGQRHGDLTVYTAGIDTELDVEDRIVPGIGDISGRLFGGTDFNPEVVPA